MKIVRITGVLFGVALLTSIVACEKSGDGAAASGDKIGVAECDDFLAKYEKCIKEKVPEAARPAIEQSLKDTRANYKKLAADSTTKATLPKACEQAKEVTKTAMASYSGCTW